LLFGLAGLIAAPAAAQSTPEAQTGSAAASAPASAGLASQNPPGLAVGGTDPGPAPFIADPTAWAGTVFIGALSGLVRGANGDGVGLLEGLLGGRANVIGQTPPALSYDLATVRTLRGIVQAAALAALVAVVVWGGGSALVGPAVGAPYYGVLELLPRFIVGVLLIVTSLDWARFAIDLNNALCQAVSAAELPAWGQVSGEVSVTGALLALLLILIYIVMALLLLIQMLVRLALVDALLIVAPAALVCWVLPQTHSWARLWFNTFFGTVFAQFLVVVVLRLGAELTAGMAVQIPAPVLETGIPAPARRGDIMGILLGIAALYLARKIPSLQTMATWCASCRSLRVTTAGRWLMARCRGVSRPSRLPVGISASLTSSAAQIPASAWIAPASSSSSTTGSG
jgi:hypothetical protein